MKTAPHELSKEKQIAELRKKKAELYKMGAKFIVILLSLVCGLIAFIFLVYRDGPEGLRLLQESGQDLFTVEFGPVDILIIMTILLSSIWAAVDSSKIEYIKYESGISTSPVLLALGWMAAWIIIFPWYLIQRSKIINGTAELKEPKESENK